MDGGRIITTGILASLGPVRIMAVRIQEGLLYEELINMLCNLTSPLILPSKDIQTWQRHTHLLTYLSIVVLLLNLQ